MNKDFFKRLLRGSAAGSTNRKTSQIQTGNERRLIDLCAVPVQVAINTLASTLRGLTSEEAEHRLDEYGPNELSHGKRLGFWADIFHRCRSPLVIQLLIIALVSAFIGEVKSSLIVGAMVVLSVGLSYILDRRSSQAVESLGKRVQSRTLVLRDGKETEIKISDVVPGDVVLLQAGSIIPADLRLLAAKDFFVSQSVLTGESMAVEKTAEGKPALRPVCRRGPGQRLLSRDQRDQRHGSRRGGEHRNANPVRGHLRTTDREDGRRRVSTGACVPSPG